MSPRARSFLLSAICCTIFGQQEPAFDVASVKANKTESHAMYNQADPLMASWKHYTLESLVAIAYTYQEPDHLVGGPTWIGSDTWDVEARCDRPANQELRYQMLQTLLADRFHLKVHTEMREVPQFALVVARGGSKLREVHEEDLKENPIGTRIGSKSFDGHGIPVDQFARWLKMELARPVVDRTGLAGIYDIKLSFVSDENASDSGSEASVFVGLQALGLKLESIKGPVKVLVVDHAEKPSEN
jgi:uncharacterized protein (TIGR03435 family)